MSTIVIANGMFNEKIAGGDVHTINIIPVFEKSIIVGSPFLKDHLKYNVKFISALLSKPIKESNKLKILYAFTLRTIYSSCMVLNKKPDLCVAATDYWFDIIPALCCRSKKILVTSQMIPRGVYHKSNFLLSLFLLRLVKHKVYFTATQSEVKDYLINKGFCSSRIKIIQNGADEDKTEPQKKQYDIVWIGRVHLQKNIPLLLEVIKCGNFKALLIGDLKDLHDTQLSEMVTNGQVKLAGYLNSEEKYKALKSAKAFVLTSSHEGSPICIEEAITCKVPVVVTNIPSLRSAFGDRIEYALPTPETFVAAILKTIQSNKCPEPQTWDKVRMQIKDLIS